LPPRLPIDQTQVGNDVYNYGGLLPFGKNLASGTVNQFGFNLTPEQNAGIENISNLAARTRALPISGVSRDSVQREKWNNQNIPQPNWAGVIGEGGYIEQAKLGALLTRLREEYVNSRARAMDPATPPAERVKLVGYLNELRDVIAGWEAPKKGYQPGAAATASTAPGQGTIHQVPQIDKAQTDPLAQARDAIFRGASRAAVIQRLREHGIDPTGL